MAKCGFCDFYISDLWKMGEHVRDDHPEHAFKCPRQDEMAEVFSYPQHSSFWRTDGTCSHCGSLRPEEALRLVEEGVVLEPTDKNYKAYIGSKKLYFQHFSSDQQKRFVGALNAGRVNFSVPGHFYVLPFFVSNKG